MSNIVITDAGTTVVLACPFEEELRAGLTEITPHGFKPLAEPVRIGAKWLATCAKPGVASATKDQCKIERLGGNVFIRGPSQSAVLEVVDNLRIGGAKLMGSIEPVGEEWQAFCDAPI